MIPRTSFLPAVAQLALIHPLRTRYSYIRQRTRVKRDMLRHACVAETELTRRVLKALHRDQRLDMRTRLRAMLQLHGMPSYTRGTELKPRCTLTGRLVRCC